jgi:hypothetical protein
MTTTITSGINTIAPHLVLGWSSNQESRTVVHAIMDRPDPDVTLKPASARTGTLQLLFLSATAADAARALLGTGAIFTVAGAETWLDGFRFVPAGTLGAALEDATRGLWVVAADFAEVLP